MIPQLVKPINGLNYDLQELEKIKDYCFEHAARAEEAQNLINDLIKSGLLILHSMIGVVVKLMKN